MPKPYREVTSDEWARVSHLVPELQPREEKRGRKRGDARAVFNAALWVVVSRRPWAELPGHYPPYQTCHRRWKAWMDNGIFERMMRELFGKAASELMASIRRRVRSNAGPTA